VPTVAPNAPMAATPVAAVTRPRRLISESNMCFPFHDR
jgi:hypothetical protein